MLNSAAGLQRIAPRSTGDGQRVDQDAAMATVCNYLNGDIGVRQAGVAILNNLGTIDHPAQVTKAELETLVGVTTGQIPVGVEPMPHPKIAKPSHGFCVIWFPDDAPNHVAALESEMGLLGPRLNA